MHFVKPWYYRAVGSTHNPKCKRAGLQSSAALKKPTYIQNSKRKKRGRETRQALRGIKCAEDSNKLKLWRLSQRGREMK